MASENPNYNVPSSESMAEILAPLAQPEVSDSTVETSSDDAVSTESREQKTDSCTDSPSQNKSISYPTTEPIAKESLNEVTLTHDDTTSEGFVKDLESEVASGAYVDVPLHDESQPVPAKNLILATESGPSTSKDRPKSLAFSVGPSTSKDASPLACSSKKLISGVENPIYLVQETSPSEYSSKELVSAAESDTPLAGNDDNLTDQNQTNSEEEPSVETPVPFQCSTVWDYTVHYMQKWQAYSLFITDSIFLVPFQVLLIALAISAIAMGHAFLYHCPMAMEVPVLIMTLGHVGALLNCLRIAFVFYNFRSLVRRYLAVQRGIIIAVNGVFLILFSCEFCTFFSYTPNSNPDSEDYCNPGFYVYAHVLNWVVAFLVVVLSIVHLPAFLFYTFRIGGPGLPVDE